LADSETVELSLEQVQLAGHLELLPPIVQTAVATEFVGGMATDLER
jgi:hypothetical protein